MLLKNRAKFKLYLDLEWIFSRLSHEYSFKIYPYNAHPIRIYSGEFIVDNISESETVLDLGCNHGDIAKIISKKAKHVVGIDHDKVPLTIAMDTYNDVSNLEFICVDAYKYLENNTTPFDVLILSHILEHLDNPKEFLEKFSPFFKKIYIELPDFDASYLNHYREKLNVKLIYTDNDHIHEFDRKEIVELIKSCNLVIDIVEYRYGVQKIWCSHN